MKKKVKQWASLTGSLLCAASYILCGGLWIYKGWLRGSRFTQFLGLIWLAGALIWCVRACREFCTIKENERQMEDTLP